MEIEKENKGGNGGEMTRKSYFQMPLHYPRYTKEDYLDMPETMLDRLLAEYGLSVSGDLAFKRQFAIGAFLWPSLLNAQT